MRIAFIIDARSPIALNWGRYFVARGHEVHVISTYPCAEEVLPGATVYSVPVAFAQLSRVSHGGSVGERKVGVASRALAELRSGIFAPVTLYARNTLAPVDLYRKRAAMQAIIDRIKPDIVHAMRIPYEGMIAAMLDLHAPLLVSIWGNDITLQAAHNPVVAHFTRRTLRRADALHCDCARDERDGIRWGFDPRRPHRVLPGAGGVQRDMFHPGAADAALLARLGIEAGRPLVVNPRGFRAYVRNDVYFAAIADVVRAVPEAMFVSVGMEGNPVAEGWVRRYDIGKSVRLAGALSRAEMAALFRSSMISVSPSMHDGTPNTLLESMACGCLPVAGDIESVREWITHGDNGLLFDVGSATGLARELVRGLQDAELRERAQERNGQLIDARADYARVMPAAEEYYGGILALRDSRRPVEVR